MFRRLRHRLDRIWFALTHRRTFRVCARGVHLYAPFRVDGGAGVEIGAQTVFQRGSWLYCSEAETARAVLKIGEGCLFGYNNHIAAVQDVRIGSYVLTANNVYISDNIHGYHDLSKPIMFQPVEFKGAVVIGDGSWIGENACIIGAKVGRNCVVGANAVVTSDVPDYSVVVGAPAVVIKQFDPQVKEWVSMRGRA